MFKIQYPTCLGMQIEQLSDYDTVLEVVRNKKKEFLRRQCLIKERIEYLEKTIVPFERKISPFPMENISSVNNLGTSIRAQFCNYNHKLCKNTDFLHVTYKFLIPGEIAKCERVCVSWNRFVRLFGKQIWENFLNADETASLCSLRKN